ncbi:MAG: HHE domain protein [Linnemannia elongata]|nr:MAG: HHE domain protein [Linnemannia elongata]
MLSSRIYLIKPIATTRFPLLLPRITALSAHHHHRHFLTTTPAATMSHAASASSDTPNGISEPVKKDHRELEEYYHKILDAKDEDEKTRWANQFVWELARHSVGEELVMYPCMRKALKDGDTIVEKDLREHQEVKEQLFKFQSLDATDRSFEPLLRTIWTDLAKHMKEEEESDLVQLEQALSSEESIDLAKSFQRTKKFVPTRSHPSAPNQPPFETVAGLLAAPIDKLRDLFARFPKDD